MSDPRFPPRQRGAAVGLTVAVLAGLLVLVAALLAVRTAHQMLTTDATPGPYDGPQRQRVQGEVRKAGKIAAAQHRRTGSYPTTMDQLVAAGYVGDRGVVMRVGDAAKAKPYEFCVQGLSDLTSVVEERWSLWLSPTRPSKLIGGGCPS